MAQFNLNDYETVEERLRRFYELHPDGRVITKNLTTLQDRQVSTWVVQAEIWLPAWTLPEKAREWFVSDRDSSPFYLKATGLAFEVDGVNGMANKTSALENCETSAIGRALANMNLSGNKRSSREEMQKVERKVTPKAAPRRNWVAEIEKLTDRDAALQLYHEARTQGASAEILESITARGKTFASPSA